MLQIVDQHKTFIREIYSREIGTSGELINGKEYDPYHTRSKLKPLLFPRLERTATIFSGMRHYENLTLHYDTYLDEVVYIDTARMFNDRYPMIALNKDAFPRFNLYFPGDTLEFRYLRNGAVAWPGLKEGYYEIAYEGRSKYVIRHESFYYDKDGLPSYKYTPKNFVLAGNRFVMIKKRKDLLNALMDNTGVIKQHLRSSEIKIRKVAKDDLINILKLYDSLKPAG